MMRILDKVIVSVGFTAMTIGLSYNVLIYHENVQDRHSITIVSKVPK